MATTITIEGNITADPELRFTPAGKAVASFTVAVNDRKKNVAGEYEDDGATFYRVSAWERLAENVAESLRKGTSVIVTGRFRTREWQDKDGATRLSLDVTADNIGPSIRYATAQVTKQDHSQWRGQPKGQQQGPRDGGWQQQAPAQQQRQQPVDPWAGPGGGQNALTDEPPF